MPCQIHKKTWHGQDIPPFLAMSICFFSLHLSEQPFPLENTVKVFSSLNARKETTSVEGREPPGQAAEHLGLGSSGNDPETSLCSTVEPFFAYMVIGNTSILSCNK